MEMKKRFEKSFIAALEVSPFSVLYVTTNDYEKAQELAQILVERRLVACTNIVGGTSEAISSIYSWKEKIEKDKEYLMILKSRTELLEEIISVVKKNHSYSVPEVIAMPILGGNIDYLNWVWENTKEPTKESSEESEGGNK